MDLLCYEEIKYNFIEQTKECNICYEFFFENFKCKDALLYAAPPASIVFNLLITTTATCVGFNGFFTGLLTCPPN